MGYRSNVALVLTKSDYEELERKYTSGSLVEKLLKTDPLSHTYECRGDMTDFELYSEDELFVGTETAWGPMFGMWIDMIEKYIPGATLTYTAEEPGCGLYLTNDPDYENKYCVDSWGSEVSSEWVASENYVREVGRKLTGKKCDRRTKIDKVVELINDSYDEYEVAVHKWDYEAGVA